MKNNNMFKLPLSWLVCPVCKSKLKKKKNGYFCRECNKNFLIRDNIPIFLPNNSKKYRHMNSLWGRHKAYHAFLAKAPRIRDFISFFDKYKNFFKGKILEIGAGSFAMGSIIKLNIPTNVIITDVSLNAIKLNMKTAEFIGKMGDFYMVCDSGMLPFRNMLFDCVFGSSILSHFSNFQQYLKEINRVLKPGRYIGISEFACSKIFQPIYKKSPYFKIYKRLEVQKKLIDVNRFKKEFLLAGFKEVKIHYCKNVIFHTYTPAIIRYYQLIYWFPNFLVDNFLCSEIHIFARK